MMSNKINDHPQVLAKPPVIYFSFLLGGLVLDFFWPTSLGSVKVHWIISTAVILLGIGIMVTAIRQFNAAGTHFKIRKPTTVLIKDGLYRFSRNPLYIALNLIYLGIGLALDNLWMLILLFPALLIMHYGVILKEERYLEMKFGEEYLKYKASARRWL